MHRLVRLVPAAALFIAFLFILIALSPAAQAQEKGSISGRVTDKKTGHALPFVTITLVGAQRGGLTDSEGQYRIAGLPAGTYEVRVQFLGYKPEGQAGVVVAPGKSVVLNFELGEIVVREEKTVEVIGERRLVEVRQGATIRSVTAAEIRNLPVQTISEVLQQQAGINTENDQIHVRGGRTDETLFYVNGVANRDLVTGQSTASHLNARSVAEVNVATGAYDVRYGNALSGVVEIQLKEGGDRFAGGLTTTTGSYGTRIFQAVAGGSDPWIQPALGRIGLKLPGTLSSILDVSGTLSESRFGNVLGENDGFLNRLFEPAQRQRLRSSYEDSFLGHRFKYGNFFSPAAENDWALRYGLTWRPDSRDKWSFNVSKSLSIDQGFSRTRIGIGNTVSDPSFPWDWARRLDHAPTYLDDNVTTSLKWRRTLSTTGYTEIQASRYFYAQRRDVQGKLWPQYQEPEDPPSQFFHLSGDDDTWQDRRNTNYNVQWSGVQRIKRHEVEWGIEHEFEAVQYITIERPWVLDPDGLGASHDLWQVHPQVGNLYLRDKLEYEGFTANVGLRADYWTMGREAERAMADTSNPNVTPETRAAFYHDTGTFAGRLLRGFTGRRGKVHFSPRVIVAHPITENSSFFFNYGQYTQNPSYRYVYSKLNSISSESFPLLGNPNLNPQISVNYEVGAKNQFQPTAAINATFFVKDIYDYPSATTFQRSQGASLADIFVYLNGHFARSKGFEIELEKRRSRFWSGKITYTFQQTKGKSSDPNEQKIVEESGGDAAETRLSETFVNWNRPHKLAVNMDLRFDKEVPWDAHWLRHSGLNVYVQGQSGRPYTPETPRSTQAAEPNSKNALFRLSIDLKANRYFMLGDRRLDLSLAGTNVFNNYAVFRVDPVTGRGRIWGVGRYDSQDFRDVNDYTHLSDVDDPSNYGPGAQWRLSLDYDF